MTPRIFLAFIACGLLQLAAHASELSQADLLRRVIDLDRLTTPPGGELTGVVEGPANLAATGEIKLAELKGPGAITRIAIDGPIDPTAMLKILIDGQPVVEVAATEFLSGGHAPFAAPLVWPLAAGEGDERTDEPPAATPPATKPAPASSSAPASAATSRPTASAGGLCYFPIGFARSFELRWVGAGPAFAVSYVRFPADTTVASFKPKLDAVAQTAFDEVAAALNKGLNEAQILRGQRPGSYCEQADLKPGERISIPIAGDGTIRALYVGLTDRADPRELYALHHCILRIHFDNEIEPSIEVPLIDFFGSGFDLVRYNSLVMGTNKELQIPLPRPPGEDRYFYCYLPMPFREGAKVEIENRTGQKIGFLVYARVDPRPPGEDRLRLRARFAMKSPLTGKFELLKTRGPGRVVGATLNVDRADADASWTGATIAAEEEGGSAARRADSPLRLFFGGGMGSLSGREAGALAGATRVAPYGKSARFRWMIADCLNFEGNFQLNFRSPKPGGGRSAGDTYVSNVVYWYSTPAAPNTYPQLKPLDLAVPGLRIPGAVEIEGAVRGTGWGNLVRQKKDSDAEFSGEEAVAITTVEPVQIALTAPQAGRYRLRLRTNPRRPFERIEIRTAAGAVVAALKYLRTANGEYDVGEVDLVAGENLLTLQCSRTAYLDCWILERVRAP